MTQSSATQTFLSGLTALDTSKSAGEKFRDFCEMAYCSLAKLTAVPSTAEELESRYMRIVGTYRSKDTVRAYPGLLRLVMKGICNGEDVLGSAAGELGQLDGRQGQFVTPYTLCRFMAQMILSDCAALIEANGFVTISEPCAGAGAMLIAAADEMHTRGYLPEHYMLAHAMDISQLCYHMSFVQLSLKGVPAYVERANTLFGERFESAWTLAALPFYRRHGRLFPEDRKPATGTPEPAVPGDYEQLSLF